MPSTEKISFDQLPDVVAGLREEIMSLRSFIASQFEALGNKPEPESWMSLDQLCDYLPDKPSKQTVYGWVNQMLIPYHKKTKRLAFSKAEIDAWIKTGRHKTYDELRHEALEEHGYRKGGLK